MAKKTNMTARFLIGRHRNTKPRPVSQETVHVAQLTLWETVLRANHRRSVYVPLLDRLLYQHPFRGMSALRYATQERPAFGDLDERLLDQLGLTDKMSLLDLGCGPGTFVRAALRRHPELAVVAIDPSSDYLALGEVPGMIRAWGEALPLADGSIDVAIMLSSIRHVRDRAQTLRELRRVVRDRALIVELDPDADKQRVANHADHLKSALLRRLFGPLVLRTAPPASAILDLAAQAGFRHQDLRADPIQPVYIMELS
jgi:SAM-dependent methyltransferase